MTNKEASERQEKLVANYMGWQVVSGSGARPFRPGDVQNEYYLVECKTHTKEQKNIIFHKEHWDKIQKEAISVHKYPALITDDGTQRVAATWVMLPKRVITSESISEILNLVNTSTSGNTVTYNHEAMKTLYKAGYDIDAINYIFESSFGEVAILSLSEFKKFYEEQFEC